MALGERPVGSISEAEDCISHCTSVAVADFERQFVITTDASNAAVGVILEQDKGKGLRPVAFASRKMNHAESRYSAYERELLGIVCAIAQWKYYFQGPHPIIAQTDHAPLQHLPSQASVNSRIWKWISILQGYDLEMRHIPKQEKSTLLIVSTAL